MRRAATALCSVLLLISSAQAQQQPQAAPPAVTRAAPDPATDEGGLWLVAERAEQGALTSGARNPDPELANYLRGVACRVVAEACADLRFYVMDIPLPNALMAANGFSEVWSGILLRIEDEAQLAFLLGHEASHYTERHNLNQWRAMRARANVALVLSVGVAVAGADAAQNYPEAARDILEATGHLIDAIHLAEVAMFFAFSRQQEEEADTLGFQRAVAAGYSPAASIALWENRIAEAAASDNVDTRRRGARASIFNTHPLDRVRIATLTRLSQARGAGGELGRERYRAAIRPFLSRWLRAELRGRDFGQTLFVLDRLAAHGEDLGVIEYYRAEVFRLRREPGDRDRAQQHYNNSISHADAPAEAWRELAEIAIRVGNNAEAASYFTTYLERAPSAADRALIEARLAQLQGGESQ